MANETTQLTTIGLNEVLANLTKVDSAKYDDKIPVSRGGKNYHVTPKQLKEYAQLGVYEFYDFGDYNNFDELIVNAILDYQDDNLKTKIGIGSVNGVGINIKFLTLGVSDKHFIVEVSGPLEYGFESDPYTKNNDATLSVRGSHVRTFTQEWQNGDTRTEWEVEGGHYYLGEFSELENTGNASGAAYYAKRPVFSGNPSISVMHFTLTGSPKDNGIIIQEVAENSCTQYFYCNQQVKVRQINFEAGSGRSKITKTSDLFLTNLSKVAYEHDDNGRPILRNYVNFNYHEPQYDCILPYASSTNEGLMSSKMYTALKQLATAANITID